MKKIITVSLVATALLFAAPVFAQSVGVTAGVSATGISATVTVSAQAQKIITRSNTEISARVTALNDLSARINGMKNVSANEKANIATEVQTNTSGLNSLQTTIDASTDVTTLQTDEKSIFGNFRIYALVIPQGYILSASDRVDTIGSLFVGVNTKLEARISAMQAAGKDVTAVQADLADMNAKVTDAQTQGSAAASLVANLTPDQGNATVAASNHTALVTARADIKTSTSDFQTARKDAAAIVAATKGYGSVSTSATTTVQ